MLKAVHQIKYKQKKFDFKENKKMLQRQTWTDLLFFFSLLLLFYFFIFLLLVMAVSVRISLTVDTAVCYNFKKTYIMSAVIEQDSN